MELSLALRFAREHKGPTLGIELPPDCLSYGKRYPCFFIESPSKEQAIKDGKYSHMKIHKDMFLDYVNQQTYRTFQEWAATMPTVTYDDIRFGFQRWDGKNTSIGFDELVNKVHPQQFAEVPVDPPRRIPPPLPSDDDDLDPDLLNLIRKMSVHGLGIDDIEVRAFVPAKDWLDQYK